MLGLPQGVNVEALCTLYMDIFYYFHFFLSQPRDYL